MRAGDIRWSSKPVGRSPECEIVVAQVPFPFSAILEIGTDGKIILRDLGSNNGTYVNKKRIDFPVRQGIRSASGSTPPVRAALLGQAEGCKS